MAFVIRDKKRNNKERHKCLQIADKLFVPWTGEVLNIAEEVELSRLISPGGNKEGVQRMSFLDR